MKNILIINGNPNVKSLSHALAIAYQKGAEEAGATCRLINLAELDFSPILKHGYQQRTDWEPDLETSWQAIKDADHLVFVYPTWWGTQPALLKGFIERVFLPGFAFAYRDDSVWWDKQLTGKSARLIVTMDTPAWYYRWIYKQPGHNAMKKGILNFCGVKPVKITAFSPIKNSKESTRAKWLKQVEKMGERQI